LPTNDLGLLTRSLPIARELGRRGHDVTFCSPARAPSALISESGFDNLVPAEPLYSVVSGDLGLATLRRAIVSRHLPRNVRILRTLLRQISSHGTTRIWDVDHFMYLFGMGNEGFTRAAVHALGGVIDRCNPDAVVDFLNPFACIAARWRRLPLVTVIQADMHPESDGLIWWETPPDDAYPSPVPATNAVLAELGLLQVESTGDLLCGDPTLVVGMPETDPLPSSAEVTYIGPILWQDRNPGLPSWIEDLDGDRPVIWLYPGNLEYLRGSTTWGDSAVVLEACIEALGGEAVQVVLTTGYHLIPARFAALPPNFRHEAYLPGLAMAERCDLMIHHGGYGSCQTGLATGTPALIIPTFSERESNARRIAAEGAGDYLVPSSDSSGRLKRLDAGELRAKVFRMLSDPSYAENARRMRGTMATFGGEAAAADLIESSP